MPKIFISLLASFALFALGGLRPARAQFAVIDVASIAQLVQEVSELEQQVQTARSQLSQAQAEYSSITGTRGMQQLLSGTNRNYLPTDWGQISQALGGAGIYPALSADLSSLIRGNAILTPIQVSRLSPLQQGQLLAARQSPALMQALSRSALANSSDRFASLDQLIGAIGSASDQKGALDLGTRIAAEEAMLQNENTKLQGLYQLAQSQELARRQQVKEQAIADQGSLRQLPSLGL
ncbi:MAG: type IV secretion system family protein [Proteobacteria bacterium]|nr:type IV secretion system family protein [Pseudomonadota bacterium]